MDTKLIILLVLSVLPMISLRYNLYKVINIDAKSRGIERPKLWSFVGIAGGRGEGLILYFLKRKNYEKHISDEDFTLSEMYKRRAIISLVFLMTIMVILLITLVRMKY